MIDGVFEWQLPGSDLLTSADSTVTICYDTPGVYDVRLDVQHCTGDYSGEMTGIYPDPNIQFALGGSPNGTIYSDVAGTPFFLNVGNLQNPQNSDITFTIFDLQCHAPGSEPALVLTQPFSDEQGQFNTSTYNYNNGEDCICLRIDVSYDSGCEAGIVTDEYFIQSGATCTNFTNPNDDPQFRSNNTKSSKVRLLQNPVSDIGQIIITDMDFNQPYQLMIIDTQGKILSQKKGAFLDQNLEFELNPNAGMYFYILQIGEEKFQGKIIKQ